MGKTRFVILIGNSNRESDPNNIYVYSSPLSSISLAGSPPTISLTNGGPLSGKFPSVYKALSGTTVRNRTVIISDSDNSYILFAFDSNGTETPLLYNIDKDAMVPEFAGGSNLQTMLDGKYQVRRMRILT